MDWDMIDRRLMIERNEAMLDAMTEQQAKEHVKKIKDKLQSGDLTSIFKKTQSEKHLPRS